jgi:hypothetical protein
LVLSIYRGDFKENAATVALENMTVWDFGG